MKNKFTAILFLGLILSSGCAKKGSSDPLLIPPSYGQFPNSEDLEKNDASASEQDLQELKELLLK
ncbi:MAG: putative small lipoprotein YifL [Lentimonas sp.]|jgi:predicted small lipoprotein YifL